MKKSFLFPAVLLAALIVFSGCIQVGGKSFSDLKGVYEKHGIDGVIAPGSQQELRAFENDLLSLKAQAQLQNGRQADALVAMVDYKLTVIAMQRAFLNAADEARFIDYYDPSCSKDTSLKKTIDYLDEALTQADLATAKANDFENNYNDFMSAAGFGIAETNGTINELKSMLAEKKNAYKAFCI